MRLFSLQRNALVPGVALVVLFLFAWAGWNGWKTQRQAARAGVNEDASGEEVGQTASPLVGQPAPEFALSDLDGKTVTLASYRGKALMLDFWATWCIACRIETPSVVALRNKYAARGFEVLGIDTEGADLARDDKAGWAQAQAAAAAIVARENVPYPVLLDGDSIAGVYGGVDALPAAFFINRKGVVVAAEVGIMPASEIESNIRKALAR